MSPGQPKKQFKMKTEMKTDTHALGSEGVLLGLRVDQN
jgi:hypothetical protein